MNWITDSWGFSPLFLSVQLASVTTVVLILIATPLAWWLSQTASRFKPVAQAIVAMPAGLNPDATIATYNIEHPPVEGPIDVVALTGLSGDAVPAIVSRMHLLSPDAQTSLRVELCEAGRAGPVYGALGWNRADRTAEEALEDLCATS